MDEGIDRNLGTQPLSRILAERNLKPHDLVAASKQQTRVPPALLRKQEGGITHKMVSRACKGRRLTLNTQTKILNALNLATAQNYSLRDLFNY